MDFGTILDKWEKHYARNEVFDKDKHLSDNESSCEKKTIGGRRYRLHRKKPDASIDLHGLTRDQAWMALEAFFEDSFRKGFDKLLIIHGKGNLSEGSVLRELVRCFIENCSFAGESGYSPAREGGRGATWVILKERKLPLAVNDSASAEIIGG